MGADHPSKHGYMLKVATINVGGNWGAWRSGVPQYVQRLGGLDFLCIQETHDKCADAQRYMEQGMFTPATDGDPYSGVGMCFGRQWRSRLVASHTLVSGRCIAGIFDLDGKHVAVACLYAPASAGDRSRFWDVLEGELANLEFDDLLIMGDFNVRLDDHTDPSDDALLVLLGSYGLVDLYRQVSPTSAGFTRIAPQRHGLDSRIDFVFATGALADCCNMCVVDTYDDGRMPMPSDHRTLCAGFVLDVYGVRAPLVTTVLQPAIRPCPSPQAAARFRDSFAMALRQQDWRSMSVHGLAAYLSSSLALAARQVFGDVQRRSSRPSEPPRSSALHHSMCLRHVLRQLLSVAASVPLLHSANAHLSALQRRDLLVTWPRLRLPLDPLCVQAWQRELNVVIHSLHATQLRAVRQWQRDTIRAKLAVRDSFFDENHIRRWLSSVKAGSRTQLPSVFLENGTLVSDPTQMMQLARGYFGSALNSSEPLAPGDPFVDIPLAQPASAERSRALTVPVMAHELSDVVAALAPSKAPGADLVRPHYVQLAWVALEAPFLHLCNMILAERQWPECWHYSIVCPIPKAGLDSRVLRNTRPISLQPVLARILSAVLARRLQHAISPALHRAQAGFLLGRSASEHLLSMRLCVEHCPSLQVLLLDIAKAYDTVPWIRLQQALVRLQCPADFCELIGSMLQGSTSSVRLQCGLTDPFPQTCGVLQGSPLSCMLFLAFMDPIICAADAAIGADAVFVGSIRIALLALADDLALLARSSAALQRAVDAVHSLLQRCNMKLNATKCEHAARPPSTSLTCGNEAIPKLGPHRSWRYLGVHFELDLGWSTQRRLLFNIVRMASEGIARRALSASQAVYYVRAVIFPALLYRLVVGCADMQTIARLQSMCERVVRRCAWLPASICSESICLPVQFGGLGLGSLQADADARLLHQIRCAFQQPTGTAAVLLRVRLCSWRDKYALSAQPLERIDILPFALSSCYSGRSFIHAALSAMNRCGIGGLILRDVTPRILPTRVQRVGGTIYGTPLASIVDGETWRKIYAHCAANGLYALEQIVDPAGTSVIPFRSTGIRYAGRRDAPVFWSRLVAAVSQPDGSLRVCLTPSGAASSPSSSASVLDLYGARCGVAPAPPIAEEAIIYTDGSLARDEHYLLRSGAAAAVYGAGQRDVNAIARLRVFGQQSIYKAELLAVRLAFQLGERLRSLHIRTDNRSAICAILSMLSGRLLSPSKQLRVSCFDILSEIAECWRIRIASGLATSIEHVKAHTGVYGNERADRAANEARVSVQPLPLMRTSSLCCDAVRSAVLTCRGERVEGDLQRFIRDQATLAMLRSRNRHREQGAVFRALTTEREFSVREPWAALEQDILCFPILPACLRPRTSEDWRRWGRQLHAVMHQAMPTPKWLHHRQRCESPQCLRCAVEATCEHVVRHCVDTQVVRQIADDALLCACSCPAAVRLGQKLASLQLERVFVLPVPVMLLTAVAQRAVAESDAATKVAFYSVMNQVADAQRQFALDAWRVCRRYLVPLDDEV